MAERNYNTFGAKPNALSSFKSTTPGAISPFGSLARGAGAQQSAAGQAAAQAAAKQQRAINPLTQMFSREQRAAQQEEAPIDPLAMLLGDYQALLSRPEAWQTSGGPNASAIAQLSAQKEQLQKLYETNTATARNLYGTLSMDEDVPSTGLIGEIQKMYGDLSKMYQTGITESGTSSAARQAALSAEQSRQQANREKVAASLGIAPESIQASYESDTALNQAMGDVLSSATSWEGLLRTRRGDVEETGKRLVTATGNTLAQTLLGMKANLDAQSAQIDAAIQAERSRPVTRKLTSIGKVLEDAALDAYKDYLNPDQQPTYSDNPAIAKKQQGFEYFGKSMANPSDNRWYNDTYTKIINKINNAKSGAVPGLTQSEKEFMQVFGITGVGLGTVDPNVLY